MDDSLENVTRCLVYRQFRRQEWEYSVTASWVPYRVHPKQYHPRRGELSQALR